MEGKTPIQTLRRSQGSSGYFFRRRNHIPKTFPKTFPLLYHYTRGSKSPSLSSHPPPTPSPPPMSNERIIYTDDSEPSDGDDGGSDSEDSSPAFLIDRAPSMKGVTLLAPSLQPAPVPRRLKRPAQNQPTTSGNEADPTTTTTTTMLPGGVRMISEGPANPPPFVGGAEAARRAARRDLNKPYKKKKGRPDPGCRPFWEEVRLCRTTPPVRLASLVADTHLARFAYLASRVVTRSGHRNERF